MAQHQTATKSLSELMMTYFTDTYRQTSHISHILVGNKIVDHSDIVGASPVAAGSVNSLVPKTRQAIIWNNDGYFTYTCVPGCQLLNT